MGMHPCDQCPREFNSLNGLQIHKGKSHKNNNNQVHQQHQQLQRFLEQQRHRNSRVPQKTEADLPVYSRVEITPQSGCNNRNGADFSQAVSCAYEQIVKWKKNMFKLPSGKAAKEFICEMSLWLEHFNRDSIFQGISLKVFMTLPALILQKPSRHSKARDHLQKLEE